MSILFPDEVIFTSELFTVAQDWEVPIVGFFIISTNRKLRSIAEFTDAEAREFGPLIKKIRQAMYAVLGIETVYFFQNEDTAHGFHLWIFPRHDWMCTLGTKIESVRPIMQAAQAIEVTRVLLAEVKDAAGRMQQYLKTSK